MADDLRGDASTGQIEEGMLVFPSLASTGIVSWRFKTLKIAMAVRDDHGSCRRQACYAPDSPDQILGASCEVRASAWGSVPIAKALSRLTTCDWRLMQGGDGGLFTASATVRMIPQA